MPRWKRSFNLVAFVAMLALWCSNVNADFDQATKAYLLGDFEKARYESLVAATDGNPKAQMLMGQLYFNGEGVKKDIAHAIYWYEKAADSEFSDAQYRLGLLYHEGKNGINKDLDKAYKWLMKAFDNGYKEASKKLEWLHKSDEGKVYNLSDNLEILKKVAGTGNKQARFLLSQKMIKGTGVPQDKAGGVKMLAEDAKQGFIKAQKKLGELYFFGDGIEKNYIEAYGWSMAYAGTKKLGGIAREGKQVARSSLRKLPGEDHNDAYLKSKEYFEKYVLPFHSNAREVGPEKYRIVVRSKVKKEPAKQATKGKLASGSASEGSGGIDAAGVGATGKRSTLTMSTGIGTTSISSSQPPIKSSTDSSADRAKEDIALVIDRNKGRIFRLYNRYLRKNPGVGGKVVFGLEILPTGKVASVEIVSSELSAPNLEKRLLSLFKSMNFIAKGSKSVTIKYPIDFLPPGSSSPVSRETILSTADVLPLKEKKDESIEPPTNTELKNSVSDVTREDLDKQIPAQATTRQAPKTETKSTISTVLAAKRGELEIIPATPKIEPKLEEEGVKSEAGTLAERNFDDVYNVLVHKKSGLYRLYEQEYELDKKLQGRMVFDIVIAPDGKIRSVGVLSNTVDSPTLEQTLIDHLKNNVKFVSMDVADFKISYPVDFFPP